MRPASQLGIEVSTAGIKVVLASFDLFPSALQKLLQVHGVLQPGETVEGLSDDGWIPLDVWLTVHEAILEEIGPNALFKLGTRIRENPNFPAWIHDIDAALASIDVAYHKSHRKGRVTMYDEVTGTMTEGIGHYRARRMPGECKIEVTSDTPYPCEADFGIVTRMAVRFEAKANTVHGAGLCRHKGGTSCTYLVSW